MLFYLLLFKTTNLLRAGSVEQQYQRSARRALTKTTIFYSKITYKHEWMWARLVGLIHGYSTNDGVLNLDVLIDIKDDM